MAWMSRISVRSKLGLLFAAAAAGLVLVTVIGLAGLRSSAQQTRGMVGDDFATVRQLGDLRAGIGNMRRFEKDLFLNMSEQADLERYHKAWRQETAGGLALADALVQRLVGDELAAVERMKAGLLAYQRGVERIVSDIGTGKVNDPWGANRAMEPLKGDVRAADKAFGEILERVTRRIDGRQAELVALERRTLLQTAAGSALVLVLMAAVAWAVERRIVVPLRQAGDAVRRIAAGDLSQPLAMHGGDEIARLGQDIDRMRQDLGALVQRLHAGIESVSAASVQIAQGSSDLSTRTETQASSLQQTAASMQQLTATVGHGADSARQANARAAGAREVATRGGRVVGEVMEKMNEIQQSSRRIADIIGVIDGIAFQTNILALNAAVEAARAGEQGRGFAVVAGEVRSLAQRSAQAAREIKSLIGASVQSVEAGGALVGSAGSTMNEIVQQVQRVSALIGEITQAAAEQSQGIAQVGQAVTQLDDNTQRNAALVEQSAAAADSLREQAQRLAEAVAVFRLRAEQA
jgi:methyl-accepting chemotaxis protein